MNETAYAQRFGGSRTPLQQLANGTDITFKRPPATAATWTRNDFRDLAAGDADTSRYPEHATLKDGVFIHDAHATLFAVHPSTRGHLEAGEQPLYIAPSGTTRGFVDYRVRIPNESETNDSRISWSLVEHEITEVRLKAGDEVVTRTRGSHTPEFQYDVDKAWGTTLTLEADIEVRLKKTSQTTLPGQTQREITYPTETVTVSDSIDVEVYNLRASAYYAEYPNGDTGVTIFQSRPWQGYTLTSDGESTVRGVWRFYTARDPKWDTLVQATETGETEVPSDALPVYVHAYPSRIGPRTEPIRDGPEIIDSWGEERTSPLGTIGDNVSVEVVGQPYTPTYGLAVRAAEVDRDALHVSGIVRGVNATPTRQSLDDRSEREIRESQLTTTVIDQSKNSAKIRIELRDDETGSPIDLTDDRRQASLSGESSGGYITIANQRVRTNESGIAVVTVTQPGFYTARYHPTTWLVVDPAYVPDTATARWHPLGTLDGWVALFIEVGWQFVPFAVMFYVGRHALRIFGPLDDSERYP